MRTQQSIWEKEHSDGLTLKGMQPIEPSSFVISFYEFLKKQGKTTGNVIDIGCGKGRNAIYLALEGYNVTAIDYSKIAIEFAQQQSKLKHANITFILGEIDKPWPFPSNSFDIAIDCFSSIDIETKKGREIYRDELFRTLKPGGLVFVAVVSSEDELEKEMILHSPGEEKNSSIWPSGKFQKDYDKEELREFYHMFDMLELKEITKPAEKLNKKYTATNYWIVLQKPEL